MKVKLVKESINEVSAKTALSAASKADNYGQKERSFNFGRLYLNEFLGKSLMGGVITDIGFFYYGKESTIVIKLEIPAGRTTSKSRIEYINYDLENDNYTFYDDVPLSRQDARILGKIATKVNEDTKYKSGTQHFNMDDSMYRSQE